MRILIGDILMELISEPREINGEKFTAFAIDTKGRLFKIEWNILEGDIVNDWDIPDKAIWLSSNYKKESMKLFNKLADKNKHVWSEAQ